MFHYKQITIRLFISFIILFLAGCQLQIPLNYYPYYKYDYSSPVKIMRNILQQKVYANIKIGTPETIIQLPLRFDSNDFFIVDSASVSNKTDEFTDIKYYNSSGSKSFDDTDDGQSYNGDDFDFGYYKKDIFNFNGKNYEIEFYFPLDYTKYDSGGIGMKLVPEDTISDTTPDKKRTFFEKLKKNGLTKGYFWNIFYNTRQYKKDEEAFLLIGCLPHEMNKDLGYYKNGYFNKENERTVRIEMKGSLYIQNIFEIDFIYGYEGNNQKKIIDGFPSGVTDYKKLQLDYLSGAVRGPTDLKSFYHKVFEEYILKKQCFNETFKEVGSSNYFYYCKNDKNIISKIKSVFPGVNFRSQDLEYNFTLDANDLFIEENGYVYCLLYFSTNAVKNWIMGKPFLKKYQFTINYDEKYIAFYRNENKEIGGSSGIGIGVLILVIILTIIIVVIISWIIFKFFIYEKLFRKKRANELDDADFDYTPKNDNEKDGLNINM